MAQRLRELVDDLRPISLEKLDEQAPLLRRVDNKYMVDEDAFGELISRLRDDHDVLEIEGRRILGYENTYFDTSELRCFHDHEDGRTPRFKARTRFYRDTDACVFEVKLKKDDDETDKRQIDYDPDERDRITGTAADFLDKTLEEAGIGLEDPLEASLGNRFERSTLAAREEAQRLTCDTGIKLWRPDENERHLQQGLVLLETKSEDGEGLADRALNDMGVEPISLSKYRVGMRMLTGLGSGGEAEQVQHYFE